MKLRMGTRGSALALAQSGQAARALERLTPDLEVETVVITTSGDRFQSSGPGEERAIPGGAKGLFVKEIEDALLKGEIDFAVHSGKDLPAAIAEGTCIAAYPEREDPRDVFIGRPGLKWAGLGAAHKVGTTALRRAIQLRRARGAGTLPMRGNVDTRLRKLAEGACDGLLLAAAGLKRLGRLDPSYELVPADVIVPAPAQGALALQARVDRTDARRIVSTLDDPETRASVECERAFMKAMSGGCATPLGAWARRTNGEFAISFFWSEEDGSRATSSECRMKSGAAPEALAAAAAGAIKKGLAGR